MPAPSLGPTLLVLLLAAAGIAQAVQNLLLGAMVARGLPPIAALALNSGVGLVLLVGLNLALYGPTVVSTVTEAGRWWFVLPGLLGTLVVFALLLGYARLGATIPSATVIAGQLLAAAALDASGLSNRAAPMGATTWIGLALLLAGAALVLLPSSR